MAKLLEKKNFGRTFKKDHKRMNKLYFHLNVFEESFDQLTAFKAHIAGIKLRLN